MDFEETLQNLKKYINISFAKECYDAMKHNTVIFNQGIEKEKNDLISLYVKRLEIAKKLSPQNYTTEELDSWANALKDLKSSNAKILLLNSFRTEEKRFMLFWDKTTRKLESIFYLNLTETIKGQEDHYMSLAKKKFTVSSLKYIGGKKVKEWNSTNSTNN